MVALPGASGTWVLRDAHPHFNPSKGPLLTSGQKTRDLSPRQGSSGCKVPTGIHLHKYNPGQVGQGLGNAPELAVSTGQLGREGGRARAGFLVVL